jgi:hypothetical protein
MTSPAAPNPFEVLRLDPAASEEEIVRQAGRLRQRAADETEMNCIRQAVQALTGSAEERQRLALLTHPRPDYSPPVLERLAAAFRRSPVTATSTPCPELDQEEFQSLLLALVVEELDLPPQVFEPVAAAPNPGELRRQLAEALWQSLVCDPRG